MLKVKVEPILRGRDFDTAGFRRDVTAVMVDVAADGQRYIAKYPAQTLKKSGYRRTGTLKRSWSHKVTASSNTIIGEIGSNSNIAPYNKAVQGSPQARLFRNTSWRNIDDLRRVAENDLRQRLDDLAGRHLS